MKSKCDQSDYTVKTVGKVIETLEILAAYNSGISLTDLANKLDLSRNKTFRLLSTLCESDLIEKDSVSGTYRLGISSVVLGQKFLMSSSVVNYTHPVIESLARKHGEAVYMSVLRDNEVLFLDMVDCDQKVKATPLIGNSYPFFTNAAGKVLKAIDSRDVLERVFRKRGNSKKPLPDVGNLANELEEIRNRGVAVDSGGLGEGLISVAVAVRDYAGKVVCAITLIGPSFRLLAERLEKEIIPSMVQEAAVLSGRFGYLAA